MVSKKEHTMLTSKVTKRSTTTTNTMIKVLQPLHTSSRCLKTLHMANNVAVLVTTLTRSLRHLAISL